MSGRPQICFTFVGNVTRDSRLRRFVSSASSVAQTTVITLTDDPAAVFPGTEILSFERTQSLRRTLPAFWNRAAAISAEHAFDLYVAADLYSLPLAARLARRAGKPLVYDARELYRAIAALEGRSMTQRFWTWLEQRYAFRADVVLTVNGSIADVLRQDFHDVRVFHNYPDGSREGERSNLLREALGIADEVPVLLSQGGLQRGRGAFVCIDALCDVPSAALVFLGDGPLHEDILRHAQQRGVADRVHIHAAVPSTGLLTWTASADIGLCMIENLGQSYYLSLPNKLFEYIAAGLPVVGSDFPEIGHVIRECGIGAVTAPDSASALAGSVRRILDEPTYQEVLRNRSAACAERFHWKREEEDFVSLLRTQLGRESG